ncbi:MAG: MFS transporter [Acidimicrobiales bacterium]
MPVSTSILSRPLGAPLAPAGPAGVFARLIASRAVFLFVILAAQLMVVLDTTIVNVALPHIASGLHLSPSALSWVLNAYILTFGGLLLLGARAGDLLGRRRVFLAGIALFSVSSFVGGVAATGWMLLAARAAQGIGAALAAPSALSLLTTVFAEGPERTRAIGLFTTVSAAGGATGLVAGGLLTELVSWRWVMFVNVPIGLAVIALGTRVLAETSRRHGRFDLTGAVTSTLGMSGVVLGLVEAGNHGWTDTSAVGPLALGVVLLTSFVFTERRAAEPILPLGLLTHATRNAANLARALVYAGMYGLFFYLSQFLQEVEGYSPLRAGLSFLPMPLSVFLASQLASRVLLQRYTQRQVITGAISLSVLGLLMATQIHTGISYGEIAVSLIFVGAGSGVSFVSLTTVSLTGVAPADAGAASGLINVSQQMGAAVGLAVLVNIFGTLTHHVRITAGASVAAARTAEVVIVGGLHDVFEVATLFALAALGLVVAVVGRAQRAAPEVRTLGPAIVAQPVRGDDRADSGREPAA